MQRRYVAIWFRHLTTDRMVRRYPELKGKAFVLSAPERGRMVVKAASLAATKRGIHSGMVVADCRAILPELGVYDNEPDLAERLLNALAEWCLRYTPIVAVDLPDGLLLDVSGCTHLWGGEHAYFNNLIARLRAFGYDIEAGMADTIGAAWAISRYGQVTMVIESGWHQEAIKPLPASALRLDADSVQKLEKLGFYLIQSFIQLPRESLRRRFGKKILLRIDQATGYEPEFLLPVKPVVPYQERLPSLEPIRTAKGIEIAIVKLLERLCARLTKEDKGLRVVFLRCYRIDNKVQEIQVGTNRPSRNVSHLFKLFELKIPQIEPALGIELFMLEATGIEDMTSEQEALWSNKVNHDGEIAELLDRLAGKVGIKTIHRYLPDERHWPERSVKEAHSLDDLTTLEWDDSLPRPVRLLPIPEPIDVTVQLPDYPPMLFKYRGTLHKVVRADGPERIEQEWWIEKGLFRDYYCIEDESGKRYWLFRHGPYDDHDPKWFIHGFFA